MPDRFKGFSSIDYHQFFKMCWNWKLREKCDTFFLDSLLQECQVLVRLVGDSLVMKLLANRYFQERKRLICFSNFFPGSQFGSNDEYLSPVGTALVWLIKSLAKTQSWRISGLISESLLLISWHPAGTLTSCKCRGKKWRTEIKQLAPDSFEGFIPNMW